jgi:hypothetical protein
VNYKWDEWVKSEFTNIKNSNVSEYCLYGIIFLQRDSINGALNILKRAGAKMSCAGKRQRKEEHQFNEEVMERKREIKETLKKVKEKHDEESRTEQNESHIWQEKEAHHINASITQKEDTCGKPYGIL